MFLDASAAIAILAGEAEGPALAQHLDEAKHVYASPLMIYESVMGLARIFDISTADAAFALDQLLRDIGAEIVPINAEIGFEAIRAFARFGRGRHSARLNMGDCFAYACAKSLNVPLLYKGDDFAQTDIASP